MPFSSWFKRTRKSSPSSRRKNRRPLITYRLRLEVLEDRTMPSTIFSPAPQANDWFGSAVSGSGNDVAVGARFGETGTGSAYLFDATTGALKKAFDNPNPAGGNWFSGSLGLSDNKLLVGARTLDTRIGSAYVY